MLGQRKDSLEAKVESLEKQLDRMVGETTRDAKDMARKLQEAASGIRDNKLKEKIRYSKSLLGSGAPEEYARNFEDEIGSNIDALRKKLNDAANSAGQQGRDRSAQTLDKAREVARGMDSLGQRMQERANQRGQQGQNGQQGQQGQKGQQGTGGSAGQKGQQGQSGQQGQAGQQGQQGQSGQSGQAAVRTRKAATPTDAAATTDGLAMATRPVHSATVDGALAIDGRADWFTPEDIRQFRGEVRRWTNETTELRNMLREQNLDPKELDEILRRLRELDQDRVYQDAGRAGAAADLRRRRAEAIRVRTAAQGRRRSRSRARQRHRRSSTGVPLARRGILPVARRSRSHDEDDSPEPWSVAFLLAGTLAAAQGQGGFRGGFRGGWGGETGMPPRFPSATDFDGSFHFCRLMYTQVRRQERGLGWGTDYPYADINFSIRLERADQDQGRLVGRRAQPSGGSARPTKRSFSARSSSPPIPAAPVSRPPMPPGCATIS